MFHCCFFLCFIFTSRTDILGEALQRNTIYVCAGETPPVTSIFLNLHKKKVLQNREGKLTFLTLSQSLWRLWRFLLCSMLFSYLLLCYFAFFYSSSQIYTSLNPIQYQFLMSLIYWDMSQIWHSDMIVACIRSRAH